MKACALTVLLVSVCGSAWAIYGVRVSDLGNAPVPPNPIRIWGKVTSESPLKITDGRGEVTVTGRTASLDEYLILDGWWNGSTFAVLPDGPYPGEMIYIPAGSFLMGNNGSEPYSYSDELPQHSVYLSGYWIGKYEVTRGEYAQFMASGGYSNQSYWSSEGWSWRLMSSSTYPSVGPPRTQPSYWAAQQDLGTGTFTQTNNHPVVGVSYYEAEAFCNWAGGHLPTEAQWEKAARGTGSYPNVYPWGSTWNQEYCNNYYDSNPAGGGYQKYQTAFVGSYASGVSPYGCHDMAGNVWEWVQDWYVSYPGSTNPFDYTGTYRVLRGGCCNNYSSNCRCAGRSSVSPGNWGSIVYGYYGFRIAR